MNRIRHVAPHQAPTAIKAITVRAAAQAMLAGTTYQSGSFILASERLISTLRWPIGVTEIVNPPTVTSHDLLPAADRRSRIIAGIPMR
jgi:hypothetical protein